MPIPSDIFRTAPGERPFRQLPGWPVGLSADFPLRMMHNHPQGEMYAHDHNFTELVIVLGGSVEHVTPTASYPVVAGNVYLLPPGYEHQYLRADHLLICNVCYHEAGIPFLREPELAALPGFQALFRLEPQLRESQQGRGRLLLGASDMAEVRRILDRLYEELTEQREGYRLLAMGLFQTLVVFLSRCYGAEKAPRKAPARKLINRLARVLGLIEQEYVGEIGLPEMAQAADLSRSHLIKCFREAFGMPPLEYLLQMRIRKAQDLLRDTALSVTDVAYAVGFRDSNYFSRQFRQHTGQTPREYAASAGGEEDPGVAD